MSAPDPFAELGPALEGQHIPREDAPPAGDDASKARKRAETATAIAFLARVGFDTLAPAWEVTDDEINNLAEAGAAVCEKYDVDLAQWPELNLVLAAGLIYATRAHLPRKHPPADDGTRPPQTGNVPEGTPDPLDRGKGGPLTRIGE